MVRTSGGIRISAGKSSKKSGGGTSGGSSRTASTSSGKSSGKGSTRLPPIPHCEAPSWQKPITNFFNSDAGPSKNIEPEIIENEEIGECSRENKENTDETINGRISEKSETSQDDNTNEDGPSKKKRKKEETDKENVHGNTSN